MSFTHFDKITFTSDGTARDIHVPTDADKIIVTNYTQMGETQSTGRAVRFEWFKDITPQGGGLRLQKENSANTALWDTVTSGGIFFYSDQPEPEAELNGSSVTNADPAVVSVSNSLNNGDVVRLYGTTGMRQIAGMLFTIDNATGSDFELPGLDASGFGAAATDVKVRRLPVPFMMQPAFNYVTKITQASQAVVTTSIAHKYVEDELIFFSVPSSYGMSEIDGMEGKIVSTTDHTFTVDIDSSDFSAFSFPADGDVPSARQFATVAKAGSRNQSNPVNPFQSAQEFPFISLDGGAQGPAGSNGDEIVVEIYKAI